MSDRKFTERRIQAGIAKDPDARELTEDDFKTAKRGRPKKMNPKKQVTLRLDAAVVEHYKADGPGWQTRINNALRDCMSGQFVTKKPSRRITRRKVGAKKKESA